MGSHQSRLKRNQRKRCRRKLRYGSPAEASRAARQQERAFDKPMYAYPCNADGGRRHWHTASMPAGEAAHG